MSLKLLRRSEPNFQAKVAAAKAFVFERWCERAAELGLSEPDDLSNACKFSSIFASHVFGGEMQGNWFHQFVVLDDDSVLDLNEDAADVKAMLDPYEHDEEFWMNEEHAESMASCEARVARWIAQWDIQMAPQFEEFVYNEPEAEFGEPDFI
jgi:hypothetical protein